MAIVPNHSVVVATYRVLSKSILSKLQSATLSFTSHYTQRYDQSGLLLILTHPSHARKWVKAGIEFEHDQVFLSVVACDNWADWSLLPPPIQNLEGNSDAAKRIEEGQEKVKLVARKEHDPNGVSLWIYYEDPRGEMTPLREITWFFADERDDGWELSVCAAVARPATDGGELETTFDDIEVMWK